MFKLKLLTCAAVIASLGSFASAQSWTLNADASRVAFGSVKKDTVGEVHSFESISGTAMGDGTVSVEIDLTSVETFIDIRNERMMEHVFNSTPKAMINASIDMDEVNALDVGASTVVDATGTVELAGNSLELDTEMFVIRVSSEKVMVTTNDMIMLNIADMGLTAGIDKLMELAKLPGITRVSPVTLRLVFDMDQKEATLIKASTETTQIALAGDSKKGKKVFKKCRACHKLDEGKNGVGPSLFQIVGSSSGTVEGFKYSDALLNADLEWTPENLSAFLADPKGFLPGNNMSFRGLRKEAEIEDLIAYLASEG
ncbi:MAG: c-type cytochrome [Sulfitobacter sp.]